QAVAYRGGERVTGTEPVHHLDRIAGNIRRLAVFEHRSAALSALDDQAWNVADPRRRDLFLVSDHEVRGRDGLRGETRIRALLVPERGPPVQIEDRRPAMRTQRAERRVPARRLRKPGSGRVQQGGARNLLVVEVVG